MVFDTHYNYEGAHDYKWHMQIPLLSDRVPPPYEIHIDLCIHSSAYWNTVPLVHYHMDSRPYSCFGLHGQTCRIQQMLPMYIVLPDRCEGSTFLWLPAVNPMPFVKYVWPDLWWCAGLLCLQPHCGHTDQGYCNDSVHHHFSEIGMWDPYITLGWPYQQWNSVLSYSQILCEAFRVCTPVFSGEQQSTALSLYSYTYEWSLDCNGSLCVPDKRSCSGIRPFHCARGKSPGSAPVP